MAEAPVRSIPLDRHPAWDKVRAAGGIFSFEFEATARCNNDCRHCYVNLPAADAAAKAKEISAAVFDGIAGQAAGLGALWVLLTGGEPLLREDFEEIYLALKRRGFLVSVFTNACLVEDRHLRLFKSFPPRDIEVTIYGATEDVYERVTRAKGSFRTFRRGLDRLESAGLPVRLKAMALRSNFDGMGEIARFARERPGSEFRFDSFLHLRTDRDASRNAEILAERVTAEEAAALERADPERFQALGEFCRRYGVGEAPRVEPRLFRCGAGEDHFALGYDGTMRPCDALRRPEFEADLTQEPLEKALSRIRARIRTAVSTRPEFLSGCAACPVIGLCSWCPARGDLETGEMDRPVPVFCRSAYARASLK
jgi:radical SAM protein with 4Fe4S-binding SPASM domain